MKTRRHGRETAAVGVQLEVVLLGQARLRGYPSRHGHPLQACPYARGVVHGQRGQLDCGPHPWKEISGYGIAACSLVTGITPGTVGVRVTTSHTSTVNRSNPQLAEPETAVRSHQRQHDHAALAQRSERLSEGGDLDRIEELVGRPA